MEATSLVNAIVSASTPLGALTGEGPLFRMIDHKRIVMLGESSHGTKEFYELRKKISLELIRNHGFNFIVVEGDWPACEGINQYIRGRGDSVSAMTGFSRWPTWMWANTTIMEFMDELREWNEHAETPVGFHGLDVYSLFDSVDVVVRKLQDFDPPLAENVRGLFSCFDPYRHDERAYLRSLYQMPEGCVREVTSALEKILRSRMSDGDEVLDLAQNARIVKNAEAYYRTMISFDDDSWNVRDRHMLETVDVLLKHYGPEAKGIVWAHNTHIGDYRATDMRARGLVNLGGLARETFGRDDVALIGLTTYKGSVVASTVWDGPTLVMNVPEARESSIESALHEAASFLGQRQFFVDLHASDSRSPLGGVHGNRAIGVVYDPEQEGRGNYVPTIPAERYDGLIFCDETEALTPLNVDFVREKIPETFPFGKRL